MIKQIEQVKQFHDAYKVYVAPSPSIPNYDIRNLRRKLMGEEFAEVAHEIEKVHGEQSNDEGNIDKVAKELADLCYVVYGTILSYGLQDKFEEIFDEVHRANMSKLDEKGKPIYREDGKVLKSKLYKQADIKSVLA